MLDSIDPQEMLEPYSKRARHLIETALKMFYMNGFQATGIDTVLNESGVSKMTLYNNFGSKEELILATLRLRDLRWRRWFVNFVEAAATTPEGKILATFDALDAWINEKNFYGCMFINAAAEHGGLDDPIRKEASEHKRLVRDYLVKIASECKTDKPEDLATQIFLLNEGVIVDAHVSGNKAAAVMGKKAAELLLRVS